MRSQTLPVNYIVGWNTIGCKGKIKKPRKLFPGLMLGSFIYSQYVPPKAPRTLTKPQERIRASLSCLTSLRLAFFTPSSQGRQRLSPSLLPSISSPHFEQTFMGTILSVSVPFYYNLLPIYRQPIKRRNDRQSKRHRRQRKRPGLD